MPNHTTALSDRDFADLATLMADNPEFAAKLADAIAKRLDERYGWGQGEIKADLEVLKQGQKDLSDRIDRMQGGIDTLAHNQQMFGEKLQLVDGRLKKVEDHVGVPKAWGRAS